MISSRKIDDLILPAKVRALDFVHRCSLAGIDLLTTCTFRDAEAQDALYAQGRTRAWLDSHGLANLEPRPGRVVTNAVAGDSFHQYRVALDVVPIVHGKPVWDTSDPIWARVGEIGESCELEWAARWQHNREDAHFQFTGGLTIGDLKAGREIPRELWTPKSRQAA
jgi:peptidoglycan L-alanyl-D-glutamate endopeptidase CwlK